MSTVEKIITYALGEQDPGSPQIGRTSSKLRSPGLVYHETPQPKPPKEPQPPQLSPQVLSAQPNISVCLFEEAAVLSSRAV